MELETGYRQSEAGVIPEDWEVTTIADLNTFVTSGSRGWAQFYSDRGSPFIRITNLSRESIDLDLRDVKFVDLPEIGAEGIRTQLQNHDILISITADIGIIGYVSAQLPLPAYINQHIALIRFNQDKVDGRFVAYYLTSQGPQKLFRAYTDVGAKTGMNLVTVQKIQLAIPSLPEQRAIAAALSDVDTLISSLDRLIAKKRAIKKGAMQQLLTGKIRLPGFGDKWHTKTLEEITVCLDHLRIPLNEAQRSKMKGDIPYCGANGIVDYVNDYVIDDDIILLAEDGGYFEDYLHRPIAYRMSGKCWVNNHAHILKAKYGIDQDFIFYSLVHKNILKFLASGTRSKLNKSEMYRIKINIPPNIEEQSTISTILSDMDSDISALELQLDKTRSLKQGMMQELLTGKTRLI